MSGSVQEKDTPAFEQHEKRRDLDCKKDTPAFEQHDKRRDLDSIQHDPA